MFSIFWHVLSVGPCGPLDHWTVGPLDTAVDPRSPFCLALLLVCFIELSLPEINKQDECSNF